MLETIFIFVAYIFGTAFGFYWGLARGQKNGITDCIDSLIDQGYLKFKGHKNNPEILKHDEDY
jgi:hypothetical protein